MTDYKLVELCISVSCDGFISFDRDSSDGSNNDSFFHYVLSGNKKIMATSDTGRRDVRDIKSHYIIEDNVFSFRHQVNLSSLGDKEEPILKTCSTTERTNMVVLDDCLTSYFYLHLPVVCDIWVSIPFPYFKRSF